MPEAGSPFRFVKGGLTASLRVTPKAARDRIDGIVADAQGNGVIRVAVSAVPEQGRANKAVIKLLSREWRATKSAMSIVSGAAARKKTLLIEGDDENLKRRLERWACDVKSRNEGSGQGD